MENLSEVIKDIAIYLRKSRAKGQEETDETLEKHKNELVEFAKKHNLRYVIYPEVKSGDRIDSRPEMQRLLEDIENDLFDAVLVIEIDRLGRGDEEDSGKIKRIFRSSGTLIITPNKVYNLENEDDETYLEFQTFMARQEYKMIKRRLLRGKKIGSKLGYFTNGTAPLPYRYNSEKKGLEIDQEKLPTYNLIKSLFLDKLLTVENIAIELNKLQIPTPYERGSRWHGNVVQRILENETHLGKIISNKSKGNIRKGEKIIHYPKDKWVVVENCHTPVKTQEEHNRILELLNQRKKTASRAKAGIYEFSGIIKCGLCGYSMTYLKKKETSRVYMKPCWYVDAYGNKCPNRSGDVEKISKKVLEEINKERDRLVAAIPNESIQDNSKLELLIKQKNKQANKFKVALEKVNDSYELGDYTREQWLERKSKWENEIGKTNKEIKELENELVNNDIKNLEEKIFTYNQVLDNLNKEDITPEEKNKLYKSIIEKISWTRLDNKKVKMPIDFI
jgi:DNA invertase Pin-like site-specific DNA recombinase